MERKLAIGLVYNLKKPPDEGVPIDAYAEFESTETVDLITSSLRSIGHQVHLIPFEGPSILADLQHSSVDLVFNIAEGVHGGRNREAIIPALLELLGKPYTGSDPTTLGLTLDKSLTKDVVSAQGICVPKGRSFFYPTEQEIDDLLNALKTFPMVAKPQWEGSSKGISTTSLVMDRAQLCAEIQRINTLYDQPALVEEFLPGREFSVGLVGNGDDVQVFPVLEVVYPEKALTDFVYSYEVKSANRETLLCPAPIEDGLSSKLRELALHAFTVLGCRDCARVDFRLDKAGEPRFLEINPLPGLSKDSLYPLQAKAAGVTYPQLLEKIVNSALKRKINKREATHSGELA